MNAGSLRWPRLAAACVIALAAGANRIAEAVMLNPNGLGQVLLFPYYTTQGGNDTLISIVNTSAHGKALSIRFLEARNGRPVLAFNLYLGGNDVWTAAIGHAGELGSGLTTVDRTCTIPDVLGGTPTLPPLPDGRRFVQFMDLSYTEFPDYSDATAATLGSPERMREGHIEVIEMADVLPGGPVEPWLRRAGAQPEICPDLAAAWRPPDGPFVLDPAFGLRAPDGTGALYGNALIVNPARGTVLGYAADAIVGFNYRILHGMPWVAEHEPGLHSVNDPGPDGDARATAYVSHPRGLVVATYRDDDGVPFGRIDAISALYMTPHLLNDYYLDHTPQVTGSSEWVVNFPTRRYYVDSRPALPSGEPFLTPAGSFRAPFGSAFGNLGAPQPIAGSIYDREQRRVSFPPGSFIPMPGQHCIERALCWQTQVIAFNQRGNLLGGLPSDILGSTDFFSMAVPTGFEAGWLRMRFMGVPGLAPALRASEEGVVFHGLPATGFLVTNYDNEAAASGVLANYSALFRHRSEPDCSGAELCQ